MQRFVRIAAVEGETVVSLRGFRLATIQGRNCVALDYRDGTLLKFSFPDEEKCLEALDLIEGTLRGRA